MKTRIFNHELETKNEVYKMKYPKTNEQCLQILQARQTAVDKRLKYLREAPTYLGTKSERQAEIVYALNEIDNLESVMRILGDDRPLEIILETNYCRYL